VANPQLAATGAAVGAAGGVAQVASTGDTSSLTANPTSLIPGAAVGAAAGASCAVSPSSSQPSSSSSSDYSSSLLSTGTFGLINANTINAVANNPKPAINGAVVGGMSGASQLANGNLASATDPSSLLPGAAIGAAVGASSAVSNGNSYSNQNVNSNTTPSPFPPIHSPLTPPPFPNSATASSQSANIPAIGQGSPTAIAGLVGTAANGLNQAVGGGSKNSTTSNSNMWSLVPPIGPNPVNSPARTDLTNLAPANKPPVSINNNYPSVNDSPDVYTPGAVNSAVNAINGQGPALPGQVSPSDPQSQQIIGNLPLATRPGSDNDDAHHKVRVPTSMLPAAGQEIGQNIGGVLGEALGGLAALHISATENEQGKYAHDIDHGQDVKKGLNSDSKFKVNNGGLNATVASIISLAAVNTTIKGHS
jgi:hypothetical protein